MTRLTLLASVLLFLIATLADGAAAQMVRWTDDRGQVFYSQGLESVPERHRAGARFIGTADAPAPAAATTGTPAAAIKPTAGKIQFTPGKPIMVKAKINDGGTADLMLDTGAQVTVVNPRVLAALGVGTRDAQRSTVRGVTGSTEALSVTIDSLEVAGTRVGPLQVVSHDVGFDSDGLLGRDFLDRFTVNIDNQAGVVTLTPR